MKKLFWWFFVVYLSFKKVFKLNLGDVVWFNGKRWTLVQGASDPYWDLQRGNSRVRVHRRELKKVKSVKNYLRSFRFNYRFYMTSWFELWVRNGIEPWMKQCRIW